MFDWQSNDDEGSAMMRSHFQHEIFFQKSPYPDHLGGNLSDEKPHVTIDVSLI